MTEYSCVHFVIKYALQQHQYCSYIQKCSTVPFPQQIFFFFSVTFSRHRVFCSTECRSYFWPVLCSYHGNHHIILISCHATFVWHTKAGRLNRPPQQFHSKTAILSRPTRTNLHSDHQELRTKHAGLWVTTPIFSTEGKAISQACNQQTVYMTRATKILQGHRIACF